MRIKISIIFILFILSACSSTSHYSYSSQNLLVYPKIENSTPLDEISELFISDKNNIKLNALFHNSLNEKPIILYLHGNGDTIWSKGIFRFYNILIEHNYGFLAIDYKGYGKSEGQSSIESLVDDAETAIMYLIKNFPDKKIVLWGNSLGTIPAIQLGAKYDRIELILEATISNIHNLEAPLEELFSKGNNKVDLQIIDDGSFDNITSIQMLNNPILMIHGDSDRLANFQIAESMFSVIPSENKFFFTISDEGHNYTSEKVVYKIIEQVEYFLTRVN